MSAKKTVFIAGEVLGFLVAGWTFVMGLTGWYKHPTLLNLFWMVIAIEIAVLVWGLGKVRHEVPSFWGQVGAGTAIAALAAPLIFAGSIIFTTVAFPDYFAELRAVYEEILRAEGKSPAEITAALDAASATQTPFIQAATGAIATIVTGFAASMVIAAIGRSRSR